MKRLSGIIVKPLSLFRFYNIFVVLEILFYFDYLGN